MFIDFGKKNIYVYLLKMLMDQVDTLHFGRYWSEVLCCIIMTHLVDLEVKVTDLEILCQIFFFFFFFLSFYKSIYLEYVDVSSLMERQSCLMVRNKNI